MNVKNVALGGLLLTTSLMGGALYNNVQKMNEMEAQMNEIMEDPTIRFLVEMQQLKKTNELLKSINKTANKTIKELDAFKTSDAE